MYVWIWRHLPFGLPGKLLGTLALLAGTLALLFYVAFPWVERKLPFNNVTVPHESPASAPVTPGAAPSGG
jgi:hypothetical protein